MRRANGLRLGWVSAVLVLFCQSAHAYSPEAYPGFVWGMGTTDFNTIEGNGTMGLVEQAIQWTTLPGDIKVKTYAAFSWRERSQNQDYYDVYDPALGGELTWKFLNLGADYEWRHYPTPMTDSQNFYLYGTWYKRHYWDEKFPITTWGQVFTDFNHLEGSGTLGWVTQGIVWFEMPHNWEFKTVGVYRWRFRSKNQDYYDANGPGLGLEVSRNSLDIGIQYNWQRYPVIETSVNGWYAYIQYYLDWDLKTRTM